MEGVLPRRAYMDFGLAIIKRSSEGVQLLNYKDYIIGRNCEIEQILEPGSYIVVPRTTGCGIKRPLEIDESNREGGWIKNEKGEYNDLFLSTIDDIFRKFDLVISNSIDFKEFKGVYDIIGRRITDIEYKTILS